MGRANNQQPLHIGDATLNSPTKQFEHRAPKPLRESTAIGSQMRWTLLLVHNSGFIAHALLPYMLAINLKIGRGIYLRTADSTQ